MFVADFVSLFGAPSERRADRPPRPDLGSLSLSFDHLWNGPDCFWSSVGVISALAKIDWNAPRIRNNGLFEVAIAVRSLEI